MRILFVTHNIPRHSGDAAGSFVLRLATSLQDAGDSVEVIAPGAPGLAAEDVMEGVRITRVDYASQQRMTLAYSGTMAEEVSGSLGAKLALIGLLRSLRRATSARLDEGRRAGRPFDIVHSHWWFPSGLSLYKALGRGRPPLVITMHGSDVRLAQKVKASHAVMRRVLRYATKCAAVSQWLADNASAITRDVLVHVAPMPVDASRFTMPEATLVRRGVLFVGRLNQQKGIADLLRAFASSELRGAELDVVGDGVDAESVHKLARELGIHDRVRWHGARTPDQLLVHYQQAAVVAIPSREEGLGLVAVEAQLCGTPVIGYASGGLVDIIAPEAGGVLVTPGDIGQLARALADRLRTPLSDTVSRQAREEMLQRFSPSSVAGTYRRLYESAKAAKSPATRNAGDNNARVS